MTNQEQTEFNLRILERVELLEKQMRGIREENRVLLEDRWPAKVATLPGVKEYGLGQNLYMAENVTPIEVRAC